MTTRAEERAQRRRRRRTAAVAAGTAAAMAAVVVLVAWVVQPRVGSQSLTAGPASALPTDEGHAPLTAPTAVPTASVIASGVRVLSRIPTTERVVFVGIDDGFVRLPEVARMLTERHLPVSLFVTGGSLAEDPDYFRSIVAGGARVEDHTTTHALLTRMSEEGQKEEICGAADTAQRLVGRRPTLFRPPYGAYNATTLRAVHDCGMDTIVLWDAAVNDGHVQFQQGDRLLPGDIVLMHFRTTGVEDLSALLTAIDSEGLRVASLEDYVSRLPAPTALPVVPPRTATSSAGHSAPTWHSTWVPPAGGTSTATATATGVTASATRTATATATATSTATATATVTATAGPTQTRTPTPPAPPPTTVPPDPTDTAAPAP